VVCGEHDIGGDGEFGGGNDAQLDRINVLYHEDSGGKYVFRAVLMNLKPGLIYAVTLRRRSARSSARETLVNKNAGAGNNRAKAQYTKALHELC
jgi:tubulin beta